MSNDDNKRKDTDDALRAERAETDRKLEARGASIAEDADEVVKKARGRADTVLATARALADSKGLTEGERAAEAESNLTSLGIVPLGIPLLAGPGAIVTTIVDASALSTIAHKIAVSVVIVIVAVVVYVTLRLSAKAGAYMSATAMTIFNRVLGLIIASIAVEFIIGGLAARFPVLTGGAG